jgi:hypothetical protein
MSGETKSRFRVIDGGGRLSAAERRSKNWTIFLNCTAQQLPDKRKGPRASCFWVTSHRRTISYSPHMFTI